MLHHYCIFFRGATAPSGSVLPRCWAFTITLRHTTLGRTPLDEWSARRCLKTRPRGSAQRLVCYHCVNYFSTTLLVQLQKTFIYNLSYSHLLWQRISKPAIQTRGAHQHNINECSLRFIHVISPTLSKETHSNFGLMWRPEFIDNLMLPLISLKEVYSM